MNNITMKLNADDLILSALKEDITSEDITTNSVMPEYKLGEVELICKEDGVIAGLEVFKRVFTLLDENTEVTFNCKDGDRVTKGQKLGIVKGDIRVLLSGERTALNYLQRMSGIATYTRKIADLLEGSNTKLLDTRKTTPNMRVFEKYAVKVGGGHNHRYNLSDAILLKDNHIGAAGGVKEAVKMAKEYASFVCKVEVEVENLDMKSTAPSSRACASKWPTTWSAWTTTAQHPSGCMPAAAAPEARSGYRSRRMCGTGKFCPLKPRKPVRWAAPSWALPPLPAKRTAASWRRNLCAWARP